MKNSEFINIILKIEKYFLLLITLLYLFTYLYGFSIWNTSLDTAEPIYLSDEIIDILFILGLAYIASCINYRIIFVLAKVKACYTTIGMSILQVLVLGLPTIDMHDFLPMLPIDIVSRLGDCIRMLNREGEYAAIRYIERAELCIYVIEVSLLIIVMLSIIVIVITGKKKTYDDNVKGLNRNISTKSLEIINCVMAALIIIFHAYESSVRDNFEFSIARFIIWFPIIGGIAVFLKLVVEMLIKYEKYALVAVIYAGCILAIRNIAYHAYYDSFRFYGYDFWKGIKVFSVCMLAGTIVFVVVSLRKYIIKRLK